MKKIILMFLLISGGIFAQDTITFAATIHHRNSDTLSIRSLVIATNGNFEKILVSDTEGNFKATFPVQPGLYLLFDGKEYTTAFLKNGFDLTMEADARMFDESLSFKGRGGKENNYLAKKALLIEELDRKMESATDKASLDRSVSYVVNKLEAELSAPGFDQTFMNLMNFLWKMEKQQIAGEANMALEMNRLKGQSSPDFDYENFSGGTASLKDFRGRYVYIDVWATSCEPCLGEIPNLQKLEKDYHGKNIAFVGISVDNRRDYDRWRKTVEVAQLGGTQLLAGKSWKSAFITDYKIQYIPRFILIGPDGTIVDADAKRPGDPALRQQLDKLLN